MTVLLTADLAVPDATTRTVLEHAGVLVEGGTIAALGDADVLAADRPDAEVRALGEAVLLAGLVNAHHHPRRTAVTLLRSGPVPAP